MYSILFGINNTKASDSRHVAATVVLNTLDSDLVYKIHCKEIFCKASSYYIPATFLFFHMFIFFYDPFSVI